MNTDLIERLAREAYLDTSAPDVDVSDLARFAALVADECAKIVEPDALSTIAESVIGASRALAIRATFPMPQLARLPEDEGEAVWIRRD